MIRVVIPGKPHSQMRAKIARTHMGARMMDPEKSRNWKQYAQAHLASVIAQPIPGPLWVRIGAVYECPTSEHRKREHRPRRWHIKATGDVDNIAKAVLDAGNGVAWIDDREISILEVSKIIGAQGEPPRTVVQISVIEADPDWLTTAEETWQQEKDGGRSPKTAH